VCILFTYFIGCHFGVINDDDKVPVRTAMNDGGMKGKIELRNFCHSSNYGSVLECHGLGSQAIGLLCSCAVMVYDFSVSTTKQCTLRCCLRERKENDHEIAGLFCTRAGPETTINL